jgi:hypothetical protein
MTATDRSSPKLVLGEPVRGWRSWYRRHTQLISYGGYVWTPGTNVAECGTAHGLTFTAISRFLAKAGIEPPKHIVDADCSCGLYAHRFARDLDSNGEVGGVIEQWGRLRKGGDRLPLRVRPHRRPLPERRVRPEDRCRYRGSVRRALVGDPRPGGRGIRRHQDEVTCVNIGKVEEFVEIVRLEDLVAEDAPAEETTTVEAVPVK